MLPLQGQVVVLGNSAVITSLQQLNFSQAFNPNLDLPPFRLPVPTILPPGSTANLIFDLTLEELGFGSIWMSISVRRGRLCPNLRV